MKTRAQIIIMSHLSDVEHCFTGSDVSTHIEFAKFLILKFPDTTIEIDADAEFEIFLKRKK